MLPQATATVWQRHCTQWIRRNSSSGSGRRRLWIVPLHTSRKRGFPVRVLHSSFFSSTTFTCDESKNDSQTNSHSKSAQFSGRNKRPRPEHNGVSSLDAVVDCAPYASSDAPPHTLHKAPREEQRQQQQQQPSTHCTPSRLPRVPTDWEEFPVPPLTAAQNRYRATVRIAKLAIQRVLEPPTLHFLGAAMGMTLLVGGVEATLLCQTAPWCDATSSYFCLRYSVQNLFPSVVWETQNAVLVCTAMGYDPGTVLRDVSGTTPESAILLLQTHWLSTSRFFFAGFMMIAQLFRAATIFMESFEAYATRIQHGQEPPLYIRDGLIVRLCGAASHVTEVSLPRMHDHVWPVLEQPTARHGHLVQLYSQGLRRPVYWSVPADNKYGRPHVWQGFPVHGECWVKIKDRPPTKVPTAEANHAQSSSSSQPKRLLILEADATNGNDPLTIGETALDLTVEDASQGFRRILDQYRNDANLQVGRDFQVLRVYLGNSMETTTTGGGYTYTLRHRIRYAKEMDVLIDSRAPVLRKILDWCETVATPHGNKLFFQTSSRSYFLNLQTLLKEYGYELYDPLDLRMLPKLRESLLLGDTNTTTATNTSSSGKHINTATGTMDVMRPSTSMWQQWLLDGGQSGGLEEEEWQDHIAFLNETFQRDSGVTLTRAGKQGASNAPATAVETPHDMLRMVARLARLPRLVHMETTAQTVNAVEAMLAAGEVDASSCCALLDRHEGVAVLEATMQHQSDFVQEHRFQWQREATSNRNSNSNSSNNGYSRSTEETVHTGDASLSTSGLRIICSSTIHDDMFRQVRYWARQGYSAREIQKELDAQYQELLQQSHTVQKQVVKDVVEKETAAKEPVSGSTSVSPNDRDEILDAGEGDHVSVDAQEVEPPPSLAGAAARSSGGKGDS